MRKPNPVIITGFGSFPTEVLISLKVFIVPSTVILFQASEYYHVPVTLNNINVKTVNCPSSLTKSFPVTIKEKGASTFVVGIEKNALIGEKVS